MNNKENLRRQYSSLLDLMGINEKSGYSNINFYIKEILKSFMSSHRRVAVYCYGVHTQMLMADFVAELRNIVCIIDNGNVIRDGVFKIIKDEEIEEFEIDGIIISSFRYKDGIKNSLKEMHKAISVLDIYEELEKHSVFLEKEFYNAGAYQIYTRINTLMCRLEKDSTLELRKDLLKELVYIKEFRLAKNIAVEIHNLSQDSIDYQIYELLNDIYIAEIQTVKRSAKNNTLLLCLDGMRREDFYGDMMEKTYSLLKNSSMVFKNAYSYSTMTFESLVPVLSENTDQRTKYYLREEVDSSECRFVAKALRDNRFFAVYGDGNHYVYDQEIKYTGNSQTITEKLWDFVLDVDGVDNGVFYLHEMYESHYSFANPYTKGKLISNGSAMLFDYLPQNKGSLRTDYKRQHEDALRYLDDTIAPFIEVLPFNLVIFADHGNMILESDTKREEIQPLQLTVSEDWIRIPLLVRRNDGKGGVEEGLISLMVLNDIMMSILSGEKYKYKERDYIKIGRSPIYNQQFTELYRLLSLGYNGEAFECFIFQEGYKLIVFDDGRKELYTTADDEIVENKTMIDLLYNKIADEVTIL